MEVIEVSHGDGLGGSSFNYGFSATDDIRLVRAAAEESAAAKIAVLLLPGLGTVEDLKDAREAGASVARIATHCTEADVSLQHFAAARDLGMETVGFLMLAHRLDPAALAVQARIMADAGAQCVYVVDSAGAMVLGDAQERVRALITELGADAQVGFHGHQNLSLGWPTPCSPTRRVRPRSTGRCVPSAPGVAPQKSERNPDHPGGELVIEWLTQPGDSQPA